MKSKNGIVIISLFIVCVTLFFLRKITQNDYLYFSFFVMVAITITEVLTTITKNQKNEIFLLREKLTGLLTPRLLYLSVIVWFAVLSFMSVGQFNSFNSKMFDLGNMDQAIWNSSRGNWLESTTMHPPFSNMSRLYVHVEPIYLFFAAIYRLYADPRILLISQVLLCALSIIIIYKIALLILKDQKKAVMTGFVFALFPSLQFMAMKDFHGDILAIPFLLLSYLYYIKDKKVLYWFFLFIALLCKEYVALAVVGFGLTLFTMHKDKKTAILTSALGTVYFLVSLYVIIPAFNSGQESALLGVNYGEIGGEKGLSSIVLFAIRNPGQFVNTLMTHHNMENLFYLLFPLFITPFRAFGYLFGFFPILLKDLMAGLDIFNHRPGPGVPFLFIAFIYGLQKETRISKLKSRLNIEYLLRLSLVSAAIASFAYGPTPLGHRFWREQDRYIRDEKALTISEIIKEIPSDAPVSVSEHIAPHLTHRRYCYVFPRPMTIDKLDIGKVEYICIDTTDRVSLFYGDTSYISQTIPRVIKTGFSKVKESGGVFLFKLNRDRQHGECIR